MSPSTCHIKYPENIAASGPPCALTVTVLAVEIMRLQASAVLVLCLSFFLHACDCIRFPTTIKMGLSSTMQGWFDGPGKVTLGIVGVMKAKILGGRHIF